MGNIGWRPAANVPQQRWRARSLHGSEQVQVYRYQSLEWKAPIVRQMVHSVEKVLNEGKTRRALTIWIIRPEENGVSGEDYFLIDDDGEMVEQ